MALRSVRIVSAQRQNERRVKLSADSGHEFGDDADQALVSAVVRKDAAAFRKLTDRHLTSVHRLAARMLGDPNEAEEVTQDTFLKLWTHASRWRPAGGDASVLPWLRTIAINACIDRLRRRRFEVGGEIPERADETASAPEQIDQHRHGLCVSRALQRISDRHRAAIILTYYEELPNAAAADTMQMGLKAFESLLLRARHALKAEILASGIGPSDLKEVA